MKKIMILLLCILSMTGCVRKPAVTADDDFIFRAKWIGYAQLPDSMKVVPGVHGNGNSLGDKCIQRAVVPLFRREFESGDSVRQANIRICGLGQYELYINGKKVGDRFLSPGWTYYTKRCLYDTFDVRSYLVKGTNTLGVIAGPGFYYISRERYRKLVEAYGYPRVIFDLAITSGQNTLTHVVSGEECRVSPSPVTFSSIYGGEDYDARLEQPGWNETGFDDRGWQAPVILAGNTGKLVQELDNPLRVMQVFKPVKLTISGTGRTIYDFGQNASGIVRIKVRGDRGAKISIRPGELTDSLGDVTQGSSGGPYVLNYTLKGEGDEEWQPFFTYYGFRYADVEITEPDHATGRTQILEAQLLHTRNSAPETGTFACSDTLFNRIFKLTRWGIENNMASVATDCPHREKLGWLEQTYLIGPSMHYNFDIHSFYSKIIDDMTDSQTSDGLVPDIAPEYVPFQGGFRDSPEWGSASIIIPWQIYQWYGDTAVLRSAYPMMKRYLAYLEQKSHDYILDYGLGDWYDLGPKSPGEAQLTPKGVTATSIYFEDLGIMEKIALLFGFTDDAGRYSRLASNVRDAFLRKYFNPETCVCATGSQTSYAMPLFTGIIPDKLRAKTFSNLIDSIENNDYALTSGDIGYRFLVGTLSEYGRPDILYRMNNRTDRPGYGYQLKKGATALTESWSALPTSSNDHMMLGHLMEWFYSGLGGISQTENSVAYDEILIAPSPAGSISAVKCTFLSPKGLISTDWTISGGHFTMEFTIPTGSSARVLLPEEFRDSPHLTDRSTGMEEKAALTEGAFLVKPGSYKIVSGRNL